MNPQALLKSLLPGLVPLIVFVAADALFGEAVGLAVGLAVGVGEFLYVLAKDRKADPFVAADTLLLAVAGGLSLALRDEIFFKLKPAIVEFVLGAGMGMLLVLPPSFLKGYLGRQLRGVEIPDEAMPAMRRSLGAMLGLLLLHAGLTAYAAFALSNAAWGFISGVLLYLVFGAVALWQFLSARHQRRRATRSPGRDGEELLPLVDEEGKVLGTAPRGECHRGPGRLHPVVRLLVFDHAGRTYLQKRAAGKLVQPGKWDAAVGGHVGAGEDLPTALARELREELGVTSMQLEAARASPEPVMRFRWDSEIESELVFTFAMRYPGPFAPDPSEVEEGRFWTREEIRAARGSGELTPLLERELAMIDEAAARQAEASPPPTERTGSQR